MNTLISVVIPLYNHEGYIEECLNSVLIQEHPKIEVLLLDDGSKDNGYEVAKRWEEYHRDHFVRTIFTTQENAGITRTMDRLIRQAEGQFILILASDDVLLPDSIISRLEAFDDEKISAVFGDAIPIDSSGQVIGQSAIGELGIRGDRNALSDSRTLFWELIFRWNVYGSVLFCRRSALITGQGDSILNMGLYSEDMQLYYRFAAENSLKFLNMPVSRYRMHDTSTCRSPENDRKIRLNIYQSRKSALSHISGLKRGVIRLQMLTYFRKHGGILGFLFMPMVLFSYATLWVAQNIYDVLRVKIYRQKNSRNCTQ